MSSLETYKAARDAYFNQIIPTDEQYRSYTRTFFAWLDDLNARVESRYPGIGIGKRKRRDELFDDASAA